MGWPPRLILKGDDRDAGRNRDRYLKDRPVNAFGVKVAGRENAPGPDHGARWAFQSQGSVGSMTASSPTDKYPGMV